LKRKLSDPKKRGEEVSIAKELPKKEHFEKHARAEGGRLVTPGIKHVDKSNLKRKLTRGLDSPAKKTGSQKGGYGFFTWNGVFLRRVPGELRGTSDLTT